MRLAHDRDLQKSRQVRHLADEHDGYSVYHSSRNYHVGPFMPALLDGVQTTTKLRNVGIQSSAVSLYPSPTRAVGIESSPSPTLFTD
jgi:hypothetical protein